MVGQAALNRSIGVRLPVSQPITTFCCPQERVEGRTDFRLVLEDASTTRTPGVSDARVRDDLLHVIAFQGRWNAVRYSSNPPSHGYSPQRRQLLPR